MRWEELVYRPKCYLMTSVGFGLVEVSNLLIGSKMALIYYHRMLILTQRRARNGSLGGGYNLGHDKVITLWTYIAITL